MTLALSTATTTPTVHARNWFSGMKRPDSFLETAWLEIAKEGSFVTSLLTAVVGTREKTEETPDFSTLQLHVKKSEPQKLIPFDP